MTTETLENPAEQVEESSPPEPPHPNAILAGAIIHAANVLERIDYQIKMGVAALDGMNSQLTSINVSMDGITKSLTDQFMVDGVVNHIRGIEMRLEEIAKSVKGE